MSHAFRQERATGRHSTIVLDDRNAQRWCRGSGASERPSSQARQLDFTTYRADNGALLYSNHFAFAARLLPSGGRGRTQSPRLERDAARKDTCMKTRLPACVLLLVGTIACSPPPPAEPARPAAPSPPPPIDLAAVEATAQNISAALAAGDIAKVGSGYAEDAVLVTVRTRAGVEAFWTQALKAPGAGKNLKMESVKSGTSGDLAYVLSRFSGGITAGSGHVLAVVQRQADGSLKTVAQVTVPDPPAK
jgi:ketosteroid isomerase-like protein